MFEKILIANRGEIALRIHRACREMGIKTVAVHSEADSNAMHVRLADEAVCIGPAKATESYLNKPAIISAAVITGADAIHPGYGFLSENADFAEMVERHGIAFIGPTSAQMRLMGDKVAARAAAQKAGMPVAAGSPELKSLDEAYVWAKKIGFPVIIKAKNGGGGKGMKVALKQEDIPDAYTLAKAEAKASFTSDEVYLEKFLTHPRHIEIQILADSYGNVVHLGERDCSIQRGNQKVVEETPSPALNESARQNICKIVRKAIQKIGYTNAGTLEFLYEDGKFYFMEMNTRLQVEHPITELVTGVDLVREQIRIASGAKLSFKQEDISFSGHAIECRINAENPLNFLPSPGKIEEWHAPGGLGVRVDSEIYSGYQIPADYDSMIAKLIISSKTRNGAIMRLRRALDEFVILGVETTLPLLQDLIAEPEFLDGTYDIHWLETWMQKYKL
ncbi:MAG: acetyl-CoA carboxylase biotin carboxylase subunit [Alphaproteobacteria bacterium]|nr:acetyl-CoA carboxylase biotin carboxylase subunit [Alphaproteobacteria bacterium]MBQ7660409.1 acetyl-CoA carboxylase biotin carboxylase subunit [Alphaproteobacteria bacterium]